jgi:phospholipase/lecithinase/hemolysin
MHFSSTTVRRAASVALTVAGPLLSSLHAQRSFTSLTMFGDSFSDIGNAQQLTFGAAPARFSNGPVWSDGLAAALGRPTDATAAFVSARSTGVYAIGGALTTGGTTGTATQIARWCTAGSGTVCTRAADANGLYTLFAGGNDVRSAAGLSTDAARRAATVQAAQNLLTQGASLSGLGVRSLLFAYLPDLGLTPDRIGTPQSAILSDLTQLFNSTLMTGIGQLRTTSPMVRFFDLRLDNLFANLLAQPQSFGFTNVNGSCIAAGQLPACPGYVFWDGLHPSTAAHQFVADAAYRLVAFDQNVALVPEPTAIALFAAGLGGVLLIVRRRARVS